MPEVRSRSTIVFDFNGVLQYINPRDVFSAQYDGDAPFVLTITMYSPRPDILATHTYQFDTLEQVKNVFDRIAAALGRD